MANGNQYLAYEQCSCCRKVKPMNTMLHIGKKWYCSGTCYNKANQTAAFNPNSLKGGLQ